jgi:NADH-quinone oxidoreductase subunit M
MLFDLVLSLIVWFQHSDPLTNSIHGDWLYQVNRPWIPSLGIQFHLAMDGLSLLMILLTGFLGLICIIISWNSIREKIGFFYFNLLFVLAGTMGVFLAMDLFLFYFFWEMMLVSMYFLIGLWGHEHRQYASAKYFIFTQLGSLFMLLGILGLYFTHGRNTGTYTFDYQELLGTSMALPVAQWLFLGFFAGFAVKMPVIGLHTWQPDAYTQAPAPATVILAGLLSKTAAYGFMRLAIPLFPQASHVFTTLIMILAVLSILYGALTAFAQTDIKRLIAYSSLSHLGFILLGIFAWNTLSLQGVVILIISHGISTGGLFIVAGYLEEHFDTRNINQLGGLWGKLPRLGGVTLFFALASLALPGMGNFIGEFLILLGTYHINIPIAVLASTGLIVSLIYATWLIQRVFHGPTSPKPAMVDLRSRQMIVFLTMIAILLWLGLYPQPVINTMVPVLKKLQASTDILLKIPSTSMNEPLEVHHGTH